MINIFLTFTLISLHMPECPTLLKAMSLGRRWAYEDIDVLEKKRSLTEQEKDKWRLHQLRFERNVQWFWLQLIARTKLKTYQSKHKETMYRFLHPGE